jgi:hypothetical protein
MKRLVPLTVLVLFACTKVAAQNSSSTKPSQFKNYPEKINCTAAQLAGVFTANIDATASLNFSNNFKFNGSLVSNTTKYGSMQCVVIKSNELNGTLFNVTRVIQKNGTVEYKGRIVNTKYADGYQLKKDASGNYQLIKFETDRLLQDCQQ